VALASRVPRERIFLDVPEINREALALAERRGMKEVFGCARMVLGPVPELPDAEIFGVTTFELGWRVPTSKGCASVPVHARMVTVTTPGGSR